MKLRQEILGKARRVVVKLGTGLLTDEQNQFARSHVESLVAQFAAVHQKKIQLLVVSSGAIAAGMAELCLQRRPKRLDELQAAAAIGQSKLMAAYDEMFSRFGIRVAQVLLTHDDLKDRARHLNARNTLSTLLQRGVLPIINENDTVAVDEIKFGDNDRLAALTATLIDADLLVILSHVEGLYAGRSDLPVAMGEGRGREAAPTILSVVPAITREIEQLAGDTTRATSVGGMISKIEAAKIVTRAGIPMIIAGGHRPNVVGDLLGGEEIGTIFLPASAKLASRKRWIAFFQRPAGALVVDDGAKTALCDDGKSLLAKGIVRTEGRFSTGDVVSIQDRKGVEFARGLVREGNVVVHRDDLVIL
jgi:glutamate 5-kinase